MKRFKGKPSINTLLNIDSVFGEYEGHVLPIVITILLAGAPLLFWLFFLQGTPVKFWWVAMFDVFWTGRWALIILGHEKEKKKFYLQQRGDEYKTADELIHINHIHDNGLIEYDNGTVAIIISGYLRGFLNDDTLSVQMEDFMNELDSWNWDIYFHNTIDEVICEDSLPNCGRYTDPQVIQERINFYSYQDDYTRSHTGLYRISFLVFSPKYNWKRLLSHMDELISSELASLFNEIGILGYYDVIDLLNRDICGFADINKMLVKKYDNDQFYTSKVLWYDDNVPEEFKPKKETSVVEERVSEE